MDAAFGSRPRAEEASGRIGSGRPIGGAHPEAAGAGIAARSSAKSANPFRLNLPVMVGEAIPVLYVQLDGRDGAMQRQNGRPAGPQARSQVGLRVHTDRVGRRR